MLWYANQGTVQSYFVSYQKNTRKAMLMHMGHLVPLQKCCGPIHAGTAKAATAEATLRARFSGFIKGKDQFIIDGTHPNFLTSHYEGMTPEAAAAKYAANVHTGCTKFVYTDFKVVGTEAGTDENEAFVSLSYKSVEHAQGAPIPPADAWLVTNERCRFLRSSEKDDRWLLADSQTYDYNLTTLVADVQSEGAPTSPSAA
ncbi:hypothetical protein QJQ45_010160 [Haematococcus lacustris]|nr:hypothetical protein QJQ45_010160 [Haematococcus lacustris]